MTDLIKYQGASKRMIARWRETNIYLWNKGTQPTGQLAGYWLCDGHVAVQVLANAKILADRAIFPELPEAGQGIRSSKTNGIGGSVPNIEAVIPNVANCKPLKVTPWLYMANSPGNCFVLEFEDGATTFIDAKVMAVLGECPDDLRDFSFFAKDNKSAVLVKYAGEVFAVLMPVWINAHHKVPSLPTLNDDVVVAEAAPVTTSKYVSIPATDSKGRPIQFIVKKVA